MIFLNHMYLTPEFWAFIDENKDIDPYKLRLKYHGDDTADFAILQIECRKKYAKKLAKTLMRQHWLFPDSISGEQSTSDILADFHASLISKGDTVVDLTAGLGIDCIHFASRAASVTAVEMNPFKAEILAYNTDGGNINVICSDCRDFVSNYSGEKFDVAFIDPARRADDGSRVFSLADCSPNVVNMLSDISRIARRLIIKMSPMLDISHTASLLPCLSKMIVVGTTTECKELVAIVDFDKESENELGYVNDRYIIEAVTIGPDATYSDLSFTWTENATATPSFAMPKAGDYLYMPYPAVMKAAPFNLLSEMYHVSLLHANTHIYVSSVCDDSFPGTVMSIIEVLPYASSVIKRLNRKYKKLNITARNFSISADALRKKLKVSDGGDMRLFAVTCCDGKEYLCLVVTALLYKAV